jgi:hypothetical protein
MPVVGEQSRFAVEYDLNENHGGEWMFGRFCYWCSGGQVGDYEQGTSLRDVLFQLDQVAKGRGLRASGRFIAMPAMAVFRTLDAALFCTSDDDNAAVAEEDNAAVAEEEQWAWHDISPHVDVVDQWKIYLVEGEQIARLILAHDPYEDVREILLKPGEVDAVLDVARNALNDIYERESSRKHTVRLSGMDVAYLASANFLPAELGRIVDTAERSGDEARVLSLDRNTAEHFRDVFTTRLARVGFGPNYEPTSEGKRLEGLIDRFAG